MNTDVGHEVFTALPGRQTAVVDVTVVGNHTAGVQRKRQIELLLLLVLRAVLRTVCRQSDS